MKALLLALSTYSKIPVPPVAWDEDSMRYSLCFFPLVGVAEGALILLWLYLSDRFFPEPLIRGAVGALIPLLITGGIHMDGFMDTLDALSARQDPPRALEILKDPRSGAFAVMGCAGYLLVWTALFSALNEGRAVLALAFILSRGQSALCAMLLPGARKGGMLSAFRDASARRAVLWASWLWIALAGAGMLLISPGAGLSVLIPSALWPFVYRRLAIRRFGGATGDTAGFFLQGSELIALAGVVLAGRFFA